MYSTARAWMTGDAALTAGLRLIRITVLSAALGVMACDDATAPDAKPEAAPPGPTAPIDLTTPLGMIGTTLADATGWVLPSIDDGEKRSEMESTLKSLANNLVTGAWDAARADVVKALAIRASLDAGEQLETGPIEISLDQTDTELVAVGK